MPHSDPILLELESEAAPSEIETRNPSEGPSSTNEDGFQPLAMCPAEERQRYQRRAQLAGEQSMRAAIELKCIDCCGWSRPEAASCEIRTCPLWRMNRRVFGGPPESKP